MPLDDSSEKTVKKEISPIYFEFLIGGPERVCFDAQNKVAQTNLEFIQAVGLNTEEMKDTKAGLRAKSAMPLSSIPEE